MMIDQFSRRWLRICTLGTAIFLGSTMCFAQDAAPTAQNLYEEGVSLYEGGEYLRALDVLLRIDLAQLERAERADVFTMKDQIDAQLAKMDEAELRLQKAALSTEAGDLRSALTHLQIIVNSSDASDQQKASAAKQIAGIRNTQARVAPQVADMLTKGMASFEAEDYAQAKSLFDAVYNCGVELDLDQQTQLNLYRGQIAELEAVRGRFNGAAVSFGALQPDDDGAAAEQPADEPAAEEESPVVEEEAVEEVDSYQPSEDLIYQYRLAQAHEHLAQGKKAQEEGRYRDALTFYGQVLSVDPENQDALNGQGRCRTLLNQGGPLDAAIAPREIIRQQTRAEYQNLIQQANQRVAEGDYNLALDYVSRAKSILAENRRYLSQGEYETLRDQAMAMATSISEAKSEADIADARKTAEALYKARKEQQQEIERQRQQDINRRITVIRNLQMAQKYKEAALECDNLLFTDPNNPSALLLKDILQEMILFRNYDKMYRQRAIRTQELDNDNFLITIPQDNLVDYPEDWPEISLKRSDSYAFNYSEVDRQVWDSLANSRVDIEFEGHSLASVLDFVGQIADVNMVVDWKSLESNFIDPNQPINLKLNDRISLQTVLERILEQVGDDESSRPQYAVADGILTISTKEQLQQNPVTHIYDIRDLLINVPNFDDAPTLDLDSQLDRAANRERLNSELLGDSNEGDYDRGRGVREELVEAIREILTAHIDPRSWQINGGDVGVIQELNGSMIVTTTTRNHRDISNLLDKLREIRSMQINVESRFLLINDDFFEQIGFDLDIFWGGAAFNRDAKLDPNLLPSDMFQTINNRKFNSQAQRQYFSLYDAIPAFNDDGTPILDGDRRQQVEFWIPEAGVFPLGRDTFSPWSIQNDTLGITEQIFNPPSDSMAGLIAAGSPALQYAITYLDEIQVDLLIKATQADRRNIQLTAPRLTFFNGQRAFVDLTISRSIVTDLTPVVGDSSAGLDPTLGAVQEGVVLDVEGTISADRRYVTLTILASIADIIDIGRVPVPIQVGAQVISSGGDGDTLVTDTFAYIETPIIQVSRVNTTVTVPDRGTILLGGQTIRNDIEVETGIPVLSKIPIINRFFTNRMTSTEEKTLMILIKPTVIIQQENEELFFPGLQDSIRSSRGYSR